MDKRRARMAAPPLQSAAAALVLLLLAAATPCDGQILCNTGAGTSTTTLPCATSFCMEEITVTAGVPSKQVAKSCGSKCTKTGSRMETHGGSQSHVYCCDTNNCNTGAYKTPDQLKTHPQCHSAKSIGIEVCAFPDSLCYYGVEARMESRGKPGKVRGCMPKADCIALAGQQAGGTGLGCGFTKGARQGTTFEPPGQYVCCCAGNKCNEANKEVDISKQSLCESYKWNSDDHVTKTSMASRVQLCAAEDRKRYGKYRAQTDDNMCATLTVKIAAKRMALLAPLSKNASKSAGKEYESVITGCSSRLDCMLWLGGDGEKCASSDVGGKMELCCKRAPDAKHSAAGRRVHPWPAAAAFAVAAALLAAAKAHP